VDNNFENLKNIFGIFNPELYQRGEQALNISRDQSLQNLMRDRQTYDQNEQKFPETLRGLQLGNDTAAAQLPGVQAQSETLQRNNRLGAATEDEALNELIASYDDKKNARELKQLQDAGTAYGQASAVLESLPGPSRHAFAKQRLGANYLPDFEQIPPDQLPVVLKSIAERSTMISSRVQAELAKQAAASERALALEAARQQGRERVQAIRTAAANDRKNGLAKKDPANLQALATQYFMLARQASTQEEADALTQAGNDMLAAINQLNVNKTPAPLPGMEDTPRPAPVVPTPQVKPGVDAGKPNPATASRAKPKTPEEASRAGWKYMVDAKGNKAYVGPNNEIIEVK
jgi:hypothetical protein